MESNRDVIDPIKEHRIFAAEQLFTHKKKPVEVVELLKQRGVAEDESGAIVRNLVASTRGNADEGVDGDGAKDIIWGLVWLVGGLVGTFSGIGYVFYGAIIYGAIKLIGGLASSRG